MKIKIIIAAVTAFMGFNVYAQNSFAEIDYSVGFPAGDLKDFAGNTSGRGIALEYGYFVKPNISVGLAVSLQTFYEDKGYSSYTSGTETLSGSVFNYANTLPVYLKGAYYFGKSENIKPYVGVGIGTQFNDTRMDIGIFEIQDDGWAFLVKPEIGLQYKANSYIGVNASFGYNYASDIGDMGSLSYSTLKIGIIWYH